MNIRPPHCDSGVLHAPEDNCKFCNACPEWQELREMWGINFTGHRDPGKLPCPSETKRSIDTINQWGGNIPYTPEVQKAWDEYYEGMRTVIDDLTDKRRRQHWSIDE